MIIAAPMNRIRAWKAAMPKDAAAHVEDSNSVPSLDVMEAEELDVSDSISAVSDVKVRSKGQVWHEKCMEAWEKQKLELTDLPC
jgi:predicted ATPase